MKTLFTLILCSSYISLFSQTLIDDDKVFHSHKMKYYYWDSYKSFPEHLPDNISKEYIYHVTLSNDSILEREISYDNNNHPIEIKAYLVPLKGALIEIDSFYYNKLGLLETEIQFTLSDTTITTYKYDKQNREISKVSTEKYRPNIWITSYDIKSNGDSIKKVQEIKDTFVQSEAIYSIGRTGRVDSIQFFINYHDWFETRQFEYDSMNRVQYMYYRYKDLRALGSKVILNEYGFATYALVNFFANWNQTKRYNVEIKKTYSPDGFIQTCEYYIKGKKRYSKAHRYIFRK